MTPITTDVLVSGGGVAGLTAAVAFAANGYEVLCVDPATPVTEEAARGTDLRTTAFLQPARQFLLECGLWQRLEPHAAPLQVMRIVDAGGPTPEARLIRDFDAADLSDLPFGWNVPNWLLRRELLARLDELPNVRFQPGVATRDVLTRETEARVSLTDASQVSARLLIAADGRNSPVRNALNIAAKTTRYGQKALAFSVTHPIPHENVSTEIHRSGGPFTLVPLPDRDGKPCSAVVWMERGPEAKRLQALPVAEFEAEMSARSTYLLGPLTLASRRSIWPIISQFAERMSAQRSVLMAEAAHVVPPIGAQGLNMSLADLRVLLDLARTGPEELGGRHMVDAYHRKRYADVRLRVAGIDMLNRASMLGGQALRDMRANALNALYAVAPLRKTLMRAGLGTR